MICVVVRMNGELIIIQNHVNLLFLSARMKMGSQGKEQIWIMSCLLPRSQKSAKIWFDIPFWSANWQIFHTITRFLRIYLKLGPNPLQNYLKAMSLRIPCDIRMCQICSRCELYDYVGGTICKYHCNVTKHFSHWLFVYSRFLHKSCKMSRANLYHVSAL